MMRRWLGGIWRKLGVAGSVAVEYGLILPYVLAFCYGILEVGHFSYIRLFVGNVANDAARYAVVHGAKSSSPLATSDISSFINGELTNVGLSSSSATVNVVFSPDSNPGSTVQVAISYPFQPFMPGFNSIPLSGVTFTNLVGPIGAQSQMVFGN